MWASSVPSQNHMTQNLWSVMSMVTLFHELIGPGIVEHVKSSHKWLHSWIALSFDGQHLCFVEGANLVGNVFSLYFLNNWDKPL